MALSINSLSRLQLRQFLRSKSKNRFFGYVFSVLYFWIIEVVTAVILKQEDVEIPALVTYFICFGALIPDFLLKLFLEHDDTVMDAFLKTRPVPQENWDRFLSLSQLWKPSNLMLPLMVAPLCFMSLPLVSGLVLLIIIYAASAFGGFLVMLLKHRGTYQAENSSKGHKSSHVKSVKGGYISGIQLRSFLRSKRLRTSAIYLSVLFYFQGIIYSFDSKFALIYLFFFIFFMACSIPQYGFAVEANFFNGIWTRPIQIEKLLSKKYRFGIFCGAVAFMLCLPICIWSGTSVLDIIALFLFIACFANLLLLINAYNCVPFDLFGKSFFNNQGSSSTFKGSTFIAVLATMGIGIAVLKLLPGWKSQIILAAFGIVGLAGYRPYFRWVVSRFMNNRYKYMEKYTSK